MGKVSSGKISKKKRGKVMAERRWNNTEISKKKITNNFSAVTESDLNAVDVNSAEPDYNLIDSNIFKDLFSGLLCSECNEKHVTVDLRECHGFTTKIVVKCQACECVLSQTFSSKRVDSTDGKKSKTAFDINKRMVSTFSKFGRGHAAMELFSIGLGVNSVNSASYFSLQQLIQKENCVFVGKILAEARQRVREAHINENPDINPDNILNIAVSYDGTWAKRGFRSNYGVGCVIDILTGLIIDYEVLPKYCHACVISERQIGKESPEFYFWHEGHKTNCAKNYEGSSPGMEVEAASRLWKRSESIGFRYTTVLSDGDFKTFIHLQQMNVYGSDISITKEECVNHIAKRLGTGFRNLVKEWRGKNLTLGGKTQGSLKETTIVKLTNYYRAAIVQNAPDVDKMKSAVIATLYHCASTDEKPMHNKCPEGENSWCFSNRAVAKSEKLKSHKTEIHTPLNVTVIEKMIPLYKRLSSKEILERCTRGKTQNANESLHSVIWNICPKEVFVSSKKVAMAVAEAISLVNQGQHLTELAKKPKISPIACRISKRRDQRRIKQSARRSLETEIKRRRATRVSKIIREDAKKKEEGILYGAGEF